MTSRKAATRRPTTRHYMPRKKIDDPQRKGGDPGPIRRELERLRDCIQTFRQSSGAGALFSQMGGMDYRALSKVDNVREFMIACSTDGSEEMLKLQIVEDESVLREMEQFFEDIAIAVSAMEISGYPLSVVQYVLSIHAHFILSCFWVYTCLMTGIHIHGSEAPHKMDFEKGFRIAGLMSIMDGTEVAWGADGPVDLLKQFGYCLTGNKDCLEKEAELVSRYRDYWRDHPH